MYALRPVEWLSRLSKLSIMTKPQHRRYQSRPTDIDLQGRTKRYCHQWRLPHENNEYPLVVWDIRLSWTAVRGSWLWRPVWKEVRTILEDQELEIRIPLRARWMWRLGRDRELHRRNRRSRLTDLQGKKKWSWIMLDRSWKVGECVEKWESLWRVVREMWKRA